MTEMNVGTWSYMSPEAIVGGEVGEGQQRKGRKGRLLEPAKIDVYSFGVLAAVTLSVRQPYGDDQQGGASKFTMMGRIVGGERPRLLAPALLGRSAGEGGADAGDAAADVDDDDDDGAAAADGDGDGVATPRAAARRAAWCADMGRLIASCWAEQPADRPPFCSVVEQLKLAEARLLSSN